jgi:uncharacterized repeat protein (TIGR01451 family)
MGPPGINFPPPAPVVAAKFLLPAGARVTAFPGSKQLARIYSAPTVFSLRPGYNYRFEVSNVLPYSPGVSFYPQIELRGVLVPRPGMKYSDYPIPIYFTQADFTRVLDGALITKVIYLEDPDKALPIATKPDAPIELPEDTPEDAINNANAKGRLMAIVRLGNRKPPVEELLCDAVDGTILLPGEGYLRAPKLPPIYRYFSVPLYDPLLGAKIPKEECFPNGGDRKDIMGIGPNGAVGGLNPTDVGAEFTLNGQRRVVTSNMTTICAPRYVIRKAETLAFGFFNMQVVAANISKELPLAYKERRAPMTDVHREQAIEFIGRQRSSAYIGRIGVGTFLSTTKPVAVAQVSGVKVEGVVVEPEQLTAYPSLAPLTVAKIIDPAGPRQPGDVVTVTLRYMNSGLHAISDLVVSDSLSGRLEFIPGSSQTDRAANFTAAENEAGSMLLRWEIPGELFPGQGGTIKFKARVR